MGDHPAGQGRKLQEDGIRYQETRKMSKPAQRDRGTAEVGIEDHHLLEIPEETRMMMTMIAMIAMIAPQIVKAQIGSL